MFLLVIAFKFRTIITYVVRLVWVTAPLPPPAVGKSIIALLSSVDFFVTKIKVSS
jgi:hypothetical protein